MNDGQIVCDDKPTEVFKQHELLKSIKLAVPAITQLAVDLNEEGIPVSTEITSQEELVEELCQLL